MNPEYHHELHHLQIFSWSSWPVLSHEPPWDTTFSSFRFQYWLLPSELYDLRQYRPSISWQCFDAGLNRCWLTGIVFSKPSKICYGGCKIACPCMETRKVTGLSINQARRNGWWRSWTSNVAAIFLVVFDERRISNFSRIISSMVK